MCRFQCRSITHSCFGLFSTRATCLEQVEGCKGDFCNFDVGKRVREEEMRKMFVQRTARAAGAANGLVQNLSPLRLRILSMDDENAEDESAPVADGVHLGGRGPRVARHANADFERYDVPFKAVVQARQERVVVEAFLRRYVHGEAQVFIGGARGSKAKELYLVGGQYPGVYYRPVRVCLNCYMVYGLVDRARAQALRCIEPGIRGPKRQPTTFATGLKVYPPGGGDVTANSQQVAKVDDGLPSVGENLTDEASVTPDKCDVATGVDHPEHYEHSSLALSLIASRRAMDVLSPRDVYELRSFASPPAAVVHVTSVAVAILDSGGVGTTVSTSWAHARAAMSRGQIFSRLRAFDPRTVSAGRLQAVQSALDSRSFNPAVVRPLSNAAANLCLWVLGTVQANRWLTGHGHPRTNVVPAEDDLTAWGEIAGKKNADALASGNAWLPENSFPRNSSAAERTTGNKRRRMNARALGLAASGEDRNSGESATSTLVAKHLLRMEEGSAVDAGMKATRQDLDETKHWPKFDGCSTDSPTTLRYKAALDKCTGVSDNTEPAVRFQRGTKKGGGGGRTIREGFARMQNVASERLTKAGQTSIPADSAKSFLCSDGKTRLPYRVCGDPVATTDAVASCNFVVVHDLFDNLDKTEVLFRPITRRHRGCRVLTFSYPGQAGTVFRVPPSIMAPTNAAAPCPSFVGQQRLRKDPTSALPSKGSKGTGIAAESVPNNTFLAPKLHELLQHVHLSGSMSLTSPFHLVRANTMQECPC